MFIASKAAMLSRKAPISMREQIRISRLDYRERMVAGSAYLSETFQRTTSAFERQVRPIDGRLAYVTSPHFPGEHRALMFGSNNYLGLAHDPRVKQAAIEAIQAFGVSLTGSMLLNGGSLPHRALERALAELKGFEDAILFSSGYLANMSWVRTLVRPSDGVVYDERGHASFLEGLKQSDAREKVSFAHNSLNDFERALEVAKRGAHDVFVFTEGLFSMDGDLPPLPQIVDRCRDASAILAVDDAHGTGVLGSSGKGIAEHCGLNGGIDIMVGTLSKALGCVGGFICGSADLVTFLRANAPPNIFTASLPPAIVAACLKAIEILRSEPQRVAALARNSSHARALLGERYQLIAGSGPILPILFSRRVDVQRLAFELLQEGIFVNCAIYPAVPVNGPRLRVTISSEHLPEDILLLREKLDFLSRRYVE